MHLKNLFLNGKKPSFLDVSLAITFTLGFISVLLLSIIHPTYYNIPFKGDNAIPEGPIWEKTSSNAERNTEEYIRFIFNMDTLSTGSASGCCADVTELDKLAQTQMSKGRLSHAKTNGGQKWYWKRLPDNENKYIILIWQAFRKNEYDWIAIKGTPAFWFIARKNGKKSWVLDGRKMVCRWYVGSKKIEISVKNPPNINYWTAFDIWYSFAEEEVSEKEKKPKFYTWLSGLVDDTCHGEAH